MRLPPLTTATADFVACAEVSLHFQLAEEFLARAKELMAKDTAEDAKRAVLLVVRGDSEAELALTLAMRPTSTRLLAPLPEPHQLWRGRIDQALSVLRAPLAQPREASAAFTRGYGP
jgi:hypothetical protein